MAKQDDITKAQERLRQNKHDHNNLCEEYSKLKPGEDRKDEIEKIWQKLEKEREELLKVINS